MRVCPKCKLYQGDAKEILTKLTANTIDCIIADPPYFLPAKHYNTRRCFKRNFCDLGILESFFKDVFQEFERVLKNTGYLYMFCDGQSYPLFYYYSYFFTKSVRPLIWNKLTSINGYGWRHQHEIILYGEMPKAKPIPTGDGDIISCRTVPVKNRIHPAEKPLELTKKLILKSTKENDLILDPFMGSGTVGVACQLLNRKFVGIELSYDYLELAKQRIQSSTNQTKLFEAKK